VNWTRPLRRTGWRAAAAAAGTCALALTACGSPAPTVVAAPGVPDGRCGTVTVAENRWVGYSANLAVFSYVARKQLGCKVVVKNEDEGDSWKHLASGQVDVILENWGHDELKKTYIDEQKVAVEAGLTGNKGVIGWYLPPWMQDTYPDIATVEGLKKHAALFKTAGSHGKGELLDGDPTFVTNDAALLKNFGLDFTVSYAGSEAALIKAFRAAQADRKPMLGYFYSPQWLLAEVPLVHVALPPYTPGCDADPKTVACDYQPYDLDKIANRRFMLSGSPAATLVKNFAWTNDDQNQVAGDMTRGMTPDQAAKRWLDAHPTAWRPWIAEG
jgi:glycine betaine/proline transport system substrate-binding protein